MTNARTQLKDALKAELPMGWKVLDGDGNPAINGPTALVLTSRISREPGTQVLLTEFSIVLLRPEQVNGLDRLDEYLDTLTDAIDEIQGVTWTDAAFRTWAENFTCYEVTVQAISRKGF